MSQPLLPVQEAEPTRSALLPLWKSIGLAWLVAAVLLRSWLPSLVVVPGYIYGGVVLLTLAVQLLRLLTRRLFWRVRNRILGAFVFAGLIPLLLLIGTVFLAAYILAGQLSGNYLEEALGELASEVSSINLRLGQQIDPRTPAAGMNSVAAKLFKEHEAQFPRLAARLSRRQQNGDLAVIWQFDPAHILPQVEPYPAALWSKAGASFNGILYHDSAALIAAVQALPQLSGHYLELGAPLDSGIERRLEREKSLYAAIEGIGLTTVTREKREYRIEVGKTARDGSGADALPAEQLQERAAQDPRRKVVWATPIEGKEYVSGKEGAAGFALMRVPLRVLFDAYLRGRHRQGDALLVIMYFLLGAFLVAELISLVVAVTISRRVTGSVHDMYKGTMALQKGDLQYRIPVRRRDQLGLLALSFNQMSASIARLLDEVGEKKRLEQELEIAREVQASLFPKQLPQARGLSVFGGCEPARVVSGDYYDFIVEDEATLYMLVGDISGKGISAALLMASLQASVRNQLMSSKQPAPERVEQSIAALIECLNRHIYLNSPSEKYVTLFAARYDAVTRRLSYCNAGHLPPFLIEGKQVRRLETGGTVLGMFESATYEAASVDVAAGAVLAVYTDGLTEAVNGEGEEFGEARLLATLRECRTTAPEGIYREVTAQVRQWQGALKQHDDMTLIVARVS